MRGRLRLCCGREPRAALCPQRLPSAAYPEPSCQVTEELFHPLSLPSGISEGPGSVLAERPSRPLPPSPWDTRVLSSCSAEAASGWLGAAIPPGLAVQRVLKMFCPPFVHQGGKISVSPSKYLTTSTYFLLCTKQSLVKLAGEPKLGLTHGWFGLPGHQIFAFAHDYAWEKAVWRCNAAVHPGSRGRRRSRGLPLNLPFVSWCLTWTRSVLGCCGLRPVFAFQLGSQREGTHQKPDKWSSGGSRTCFAQIELESIWLACEMKRCLDFQSILLGTGSCWACSAPKKK